MEEQIQNFLFHYRNTQSTVTNHTPNGLIFNYKTKTVLDTINPRFQKGFIKSLPRKQSVKPKPSHKSQTSSDFHKSHNGDKFVENDKIYYRNHFKNDVRWLPATFLKQISKHTYLIKLNGSVRMVHRNQFRKSSLSDKYRMDQPVLNKCPSRLSVEGISHKSKSVRFRSQVDSIPHHSEVLRERSHSTSSIPEEQVRRSKRIFKSYQNKAINYKQ